jgi:hypothetical protein
MLRRHRAAERPRFTQLASIRSPPRRLLPPSPADQAREEPATEGPATESWRTSAQRRASTCAVSPMDVGAGKPIGSIRRASTLWRWQSSSSSELPCTTVENRSGDVERPITSPRKQNRERALQLPTVLRAGAVEAGNRRSALRRRVCLCPVRAIRESSRRSLVAGAPAAVRSSSAGC